MKLMTKAIAKTLPSFADNEKVPFEQRVAQLKFFGGSRGTWLITAYDGGDKVHGYLVSPMGPAFDGFGTFSLSELARKTFPPFGLPIERDMHFEPKTLAELLPKVFGAAGDHVSPATGAHQPCKACIPCAKKAIRDAIGDPDAFVYSRLEAIDDGDLADVTETAKHRGFKTNTCITNGIHAELMNNAREWATNSDGLKTIDEHYIVGLVAVLDATRLAIVAGQKKAKDEGKEDPEDMFWFDLPLGSNPEPMKLWAKIDGGDFGDNVITIMLTSED